MLYKQAEGERQRRPRPIQRPQCNSSHMPSIPMRCVKVEPAKSSGWTFLRRATLNTQTKLRPLPLMPCHHHSFVYSPLRVCALRKCKIPWLIGHTVSSQISQVHIFYFRPELNRSFFFLLCSVWDNPLISTTVSLWTTFSSVLSGQLFFSVTSTKNCPCAKIAD